MPIWFKASQSRVSRFTAEIEIHCYSPAPAGSGQTLVHERSYGETFLLPNGKYGFGVHRTEGETDCQAARRDTVTGEFTELTPSKTARP